MKFKFYYLVLFTVFKFNAQKLKIVNSLTGLPVPYATIIFKNNSKPIFADYSNELGFATIQEKVVFDTICISSIGYEKSIIPKSGLSSTILLLTPIIITLKEVVIKKGKCPILLGEFDRKIKRYLTLKVQNQITYFFENTKIDTCYLQTFLFKSKKVKTKTAIRVHLYTKKIDTLAYKVIENGVKKTLFFTTLIPNDEIENQEIIIHLEPNQKGIITIDLKKYDIQMPKEGLFVGIECLAYFDRNNKQIDQVDFPTEIEAHLTQKNNYCVKHKLHDIGWNNENDRVKRDFQLVFRNSDPSKSLFAPTVGLIISE